MRRYLENAQARTLRPFITNQYVEPPFVHRSNSIVSTTSSSSTSSRESTKSSHSQHGLSPNNILFLSNYWCYLFWFIVHFSLFFLFTDNYSPYSISERIYEEPPRFHDDYGDNDFDDDSDNDDGNYDRIQPSNNYMRINSLSLHNPPSPHQTLYDVPRPVHGSFEKIDCPENERAESPYYKMNLPGESDQNIEHEFYEKMSIAHGQSNSDHFEDQYEAMSKIPGQSSEHTEDFYEKMLKIPGQNSENTENPYEQMSNAHLQDSGHTEDFYEKMLNSHAQSSEGFYEKMTSNKSGTGKSATLPANRGNNFKEKASRSKSLNLVAPEPPRRKGSLKSNKENQEKEEGEELYVALKSDEQDEQDGDYDENDDISDVPISPQARPVPLPRQPKKSTCYEDVDIVLTGRYVVLSNVF